MKNATAEFITHPFAPLYDEESRVLILGSFPSAVSRKQNFYYANPTNRFWKVLGNIYGEEIEDRAAWCHMHHIALWDVILSCTITGSSDTSIRDVTVNDIAGLAAKTRIRAVFTTGRKASVLYEKYVTADLVHIGLPSTSAANASMRIEDLEREYMRIREYAETEG